MNIVESKIKQIDVVKVEKGKIDSDNPAEEKKGEEQIEE